MYMQVGSANQDYRSMVMDGESVVLVSNWTALNAVPDFLLLLGLAAWPTDQTALDRLFPAPSWFRLAFARWVRMGL
jgi:phosphatidylserine/phosphatidylglycerophosphate/cardiolipin synthase-like enzyme